MLTYRSLARLMPTWPAALAFCLVLALAWGGRVWVNGAWTERAQGIFEIAATSAKTEITHRFERYVAALASAQEISQTSNTEDPAEIARQIDILHDGVGLPELLGIGLWLPADPAEPSTADAIESATQQGTEPNSLPIRASMVNSRSPIADILTDDNAKAALGDALALASGRENAVGSALFWAETSQTRAPIALLAAPVVSRDPSTETARNWGWVVAAIDMRESLRIVGSAFARDISLSARADGLQSEERLLFVAEPDVAPRFSASAQIELRGLALNLAFTSTPLFEVENLNPIARFQLFMSVFVSVLVALVVQMITVRSKTVRALITSRTRDLLVREREIESILQTALVGIVTVDAAGRILFLNPQAQEILKLTDNPGPNLSIQSLLPDLDLSELHQKHAYPKDAGVGDQRMLEIGCTHWEAGLGETRLTLILHDITDEYRAQSELRASRRRWDRAMTSSDIGIFDIDLQTGKSVVSTGWLRMMGVTDPPDDFDPQAHFQRSVLEEDMPKVQRADAKLIEGKTESSVSEYRIMIPGVGLRWMRSESVVTLDEETGKPIHFSGTQHDITETKLAQDALVASEERFRSAFNRSPTCNMLLDHTFQATQINRAMNELLSTRFRLDEDAANPAHMFAEHWPRIKQALMDLKTESDAPFRTEIELQRAGSRSLWLDISASIIRDPLAQGPAYFLQIIDSSELRLIEKVKREFIATVSHELRTPVTSIKGANDLLGTLPSAHRTANENRLLDIVARNANRLSELISDILDLEAVQSGQIQFANSDLSVNGLIDEIKENFLPFAERYSVEIRSEDIDPDVAIFADHRRAYQCLSNLLSNACKYSESNGVVWIRSSAIAQDRVRIDVINNGAGIPKEFEERLFSAFARADSSDTRNSGGTGLGLKITKELMEKMSGKVAFRRGELDETIFSLEFKASAGVDSGNVARLN